MIGLPSGLGAALAAVGLAETPEPALFINHVARCRPNRRRVRGHPAPPRLVDAIRHPENPLYWVWRTQVIRAVLVDGSRYTGDKLRKIRAENGVGRPPAVLRDRLMAMQANRPDGLGEI